MNLKVEDNDWNQVTSSFNENSYENVNVQNEFGAYDEVKNGDGMKQFEDTPYIVPEQKQKRKVYYKHFW